MFAGMKVDYGLPLAIAHSFRTHAVPLVDTDRFSTFCAFYVRSGGILALVGERVALFADCTLPLRLSKPKILAATSLLIL